jgi:hypothetical protein
MIMNGVGLTCLIVEVVCHAPEIVIGISWAVFLAHVLIWLILLAAKEIDD